MFYLLYYSIYSILADLRFADFDIATAIAFIFLLLGGGGQKLIDGQ